MAAFLPARVKRICPRDKTPLAEKREGRVTIDACPKCAGAFFDADELARATGDKELGRYLSRVHGAASSPMVCPACGNLMDLDKIGEAQIDHCTSCLGVWLDAGEKEKLLSRAPDALGANLSAKALAEEERKYRGMPRGSGGAGRFAALGEAFRRIAWRFKRRR